MADDHQDADHSDPDEIISDLEFVDESPALPPLLRRTTTYADRQKSIRPSRRQPLVMAAVVGALCVFVYNSVDRLLRLDLTDREEETRPRQKQWHDAGLKQTEEAELRELNEMMEKARIGTDLRLPAADDSTDVATPPENVGDKTRPSR